MARDGVLAQRRLDDIEVQLPRRRRAATETSLQHFQRDQ
jgi:hypothetical protein